VSSVRTLHDLVVWQTAMELAEGCYRLAAEFPRGERYGLTSQMRTASVSIPANIAEGFGRESTGPFIQFLRIAQGSLKELETRLLLGIRLGLTTSERAAQQSSLVQDTGKLLRALIRSLQAKEGARG
jgi:four helix bundle protein